MRRKLIAGLGNPGAQYRDTRHNIGFKILDHILNEQGHEFKESAKHRCHMAEVEVGDTKITFIKPQTFYNESGMAVRSLMDFYKLDPKDVLVVHDELALPFGTIRSRIGGSDAGNNGVKSISSHIGTDYARIRVGIWNELRDKIDDADFVLSRFNSTETATMNPLFQEVKEQILLFIDGEDFASTTKRLKK